MSSYAAQHECEFAKHVLMRCSSVTWCRLALVSASAASSSMCTEPSPMPSILQRTKCTYQRASVPDTHHTRESDANNPSSTPSCFRARRPLHELPTYAGPPWCFAMRLINSRRLAANLQTCVLLPRPDATRESGPLLQTWVLLPATARPDATRDRRTRGRAEVYTGFDQRLGTRAAASCANARA